MNLGFETIGNATLIAYDRKPVLVTDPWLVGGAYFNSWTFSHEIPKAQMEAIQSAEYIWLSHGHPDHLSGASLKLLKDKKIFLPDHVGGRIYEDLKEQGYQVTVLKDRVWVRLSEHIRILTVADYNQDAVLLVDIKGRLIVNTNDASDRGWGYFVKKLAKEYRVSFLLCLSGYDDADMINFFDESGKRILPLAAQRRPFGGAIARRAESFGLKYFIPFSSMHRYQRKDSIWANEYTVGLLDYGVGFESKKCEILPAYISYDCEKDKFREIGPKIHSGQVLDPEEIGDSWYDPLEASEFSLIKQYFKAITHLEECLDFICVRVAGKDHFITFRNHSFKRGITFESPKNSLMAAAQYEIFDDLLIGNFMKTTLHGKWGKGKLYPDFTPYVTKYADNGRAKTREELAVYFKGYRQRAFLDYVRTRIGAKSRSLIWSFIPADSKVYSLGKALYKNYSKISV